MGPLAGPRQPSPSTVAPRRSTLLLATALAGILLAFLTADLATAKAKRITGTNGSERIKGTKKKDRIDARGGNDKVLARRGGDRVKAGAGKDSASGGPGKDRIKGNAGKDKLKGNAGRDRIDAGGGRDKAVGGGGRDKIDGGGGRDMVKGGGGGDKLSGGGAKDKLVGNGGQDKLKGNGDADKLFGSGAKDRLLGGGGDDKLNGGGGADVIKGAKGSDRLLGGGGADTLSAIDGAADALVDGGGGGDVCKVDFADLPNVRNCEDVRVKGGGNGGGGGGGNGGPADPALRITESGFDCPLPVVLGIPSPCSFSLAGTGADGPNQGITGLGGVSNVAGSIDRGGGGSWTASGNATCTASGKLQATIGGERASADVTCPSGNGVDLSVTADNTSCAPPVGGTSACTVILAGEGADTAAGEVSGDGAGVQTLLPIVATSVAGGSWNAVGAATCSADGTLTVTFGSESADVPLDCPADDGGGGGGGGGGGADEPLTITAGDPPTACTPPLLGVLGSCVISLIGTGADEATGTVVGTGGVSGDGIAALSPSGGGWTASGVANCTGPGTLEISFGAETVSATVPCGS